MTKRLFVLSLSMILTLILLGTTIYAYYFDQKETGSVDFTLGEVSFSWSGNLTSGFVMPSQELIGTTFQLTNTSSVETELRFSIEASTSLLSTVSVDDLFSVYTISTGWVFDNGYYYYRGTNTDSTTEPGKFKIPTTVSQITVLESLKLDGYFIRNDHVGETVSITLTFQAKQGPFVTWATLGTANYNFSTGQ